MNWDLLIKRAGRIIQWDAHFSHRLRLQKQDSPLWALTAFLAHSGDSWFWMAGLIIIWFVASPQWHYRAAMLALSIVVLAVLVLGVKFVVKRQRPPGEWGSIYRNTDPHSFPSGHAARAALLLALSWALAPGWFAWLITLWAPLVSLARVMTGLHYLSDVFAGVLMGLVVAGIMLALQPLLLALLPFLF